MHIFFTPKLFLYICSYVIVSVDIVTELNAKNWQRLEGIWEKIMSLTFLVLEVPMNKNVGLLLLQICRHRHPGSIFYISQKRLEISGGAIVHYYQNALQIEAILWFDFSLFLIQYIISKYTI